MVLTSLPVEHHSGQSGGPPACEGDGSVVVTAGELNRFGALAMAFHGLTKLIEAEGFDEATGAKQILFMVNRDFQRLLSEVRERADGLD